MLDHFGLERTAIAGGSAGALTAAEFARRHPDCCAQLVLIVPAANLTGRDPVELTAMQRVAVERVLTSDAWFWGFATFATDILLPTLLATDPALLDRVSPEERRRANLIRKGHMPISRKADGLRNDGFWVGTPTETAFETIAAPTLILSCEDDLFGTAEMARLLADRIPGARLVVYSGGEHIWLGHDADLTRDIGAFITGSPDP